MMHMAAGGPTSSPRAPAPLAWVPGSSPRTATQHHGRPSLLHLLLQGAHRAAWTHVLGRPFLTNHTKVHVAAGTHAPPSTFWQPAPVPSNFMN